MDDKRDQRRLTGLGMSMRAEWDHEESRELDVTCTSTRDGNARDEAPGFSRLTRTANPL